MDTAYAYQLMVLQTAVFVTLWAAVHRKVSRHGPISYVRTFTRVNSWLYSAASLALTVLILSPQDELARCLFHASKFYEYVDVLLVRASGAEIDLHFAVHHLTTPWLTFVRVVRHGDGGWRPFAALNAFHHVLMYAYFGGADIFRPALPVTGTAQLIAGLAAETWLIRTKFLSGEGLVWPNAFGLGLLSAYLVLHVRDLRIKARIRRMQSLAQKKDKEL